MLFAIFINVIMPQMNGWLVSPGLTLDSHRSRPVRRRRRRHPTWLSVVLNENVTTFRAHFFVPIPHLHRPVGTDSVEARRLPVERFLQLSENVTWYDIVSGMTSEGKSWRSSWEEAELPQPESTILYKDTVRGCCQARVWISDPAYFLFIPSTPEKSSP